jgi:phosphate/sulfate permease
METAYWVIIAFMGLLAVTDLGVGVSNDAVNFLSAAVGSKAAKLKWILFVAALGVLIGASFSSGMMDIARHGIFNPNYFYFREVICIFLAVVISDVFLLDLFNSLGLPTSTTVSMVFELLGASFIVSLIKVSTDCLPVVADLEGASPTMANLLNSDKALTMIISIFLSVAIAFIFGLIVQWISRLVFTFHYRDTMGKHIGWFGGMAVTSIMYFNYNTKNKS